MDSRMPGFRYGHHGRPALQATILATPAGSGRRCTSRGMLLHVGGSQPASPPRDRWASPAGPAARAGTAPPGCWRPSVTAKTCSCAGALRTGPSQRHAAHWARRAGRLAICTGANSCLPGRLQTPCWATAGAPVLLRHAAVVHRRRQPARPRRFEARMQAAGFKHGPNSPPEVQVPKFVSMSIGFGTYDRTEKLNSVITILWGRLHLLFFHNNK